MGDRAAILNLLASRKIKAQVTGETQGPRVTSYRLQIGAEVPVGRVLRLAGDLSAHLGRSVRVFQPSDGLPGLLVEVAKAVFAPVGLYDLLQDVREPLQLALGRDMRGAPVLRDLRTMPHFLIAGQTGSGKSVALTCAVLSLLRFGPSDVRLAMIDNKRVELAQFAGLPHLIRPVATDKQQTREVLALCLKEVERRYKKLEDLGLRSWAEYRKTKRVPYLVIVIDELAEVVLGDEYAQTLLLRIAQLGRASGVHLIMAVQRPDAKVVGGLLKAQVPTRLAFAVVSATDSRVVLDSNGAESLLGKGDGLLREPTGLTRIQGALYHDADVSAAVTNRGELDYWPLPVPAPTLRPYSYQPAVVLAPLPPARKAAPMWPYFLFMFCFLAVIMGGCFGRIYGGA